MQDEVHQVEAVLRRIAAGGEGMEAVTHRTVALCTGMTAALVPVIGQRGMSALYGRALHLASAQHPWLAHARDADGDALAFSALGRAVSGQIVDDAIPAITTLFATFDRLLVSLIGASLTKRLLQPVWDVPPAGHTRQDTAP